MKRQNLIEKTVKPEEMASQVKLDVCIDMLDTTTKDASFHVRMERFGRMKFADLDIY